MKKLTNAPEPDSLNGSVREEIEAYAFKTGT
jgi:hypothetical protein